MVNYRLMTELVQDFISVPAPGARKIHSLLYIVKHIGQMLLQNGKFLFTRKTFDGVHILPYSCCIWITYYNNHDIHHIVTSQNYLWRHSSSMLHMSSKQEFCKIKEIWPNCLSRNCHIARCYYTKHLCKCMIRNLMKWKKYFVRGM